MNRFARTRHILLLALTFERLAFYAILPRSRVVLPGLLYIRLGVRIAPVYPHVGTSFFASGALMAAYPASEVFPILGIILSAAALSVYAFRKLSRIDAAIISLAKFLGLFLFRAYPLALSRVLVTRDRLEVDFSTRSVKIMKEPRLDDAAGIASVLLASLVGLILLFSSRPARGYANLGTLRDPVRKSFGLAAHIFGSMYVSALALALAAPLGILSAAYISRYSEGLLEKAYSILVESMAAIPSVVYGLRGLLVLGSFFGIHANKLVAAITLSIMLLPTIVSLSKAALESVPREIIEAAYALGAYDHEALIVALGYAKRSLAGAALIAFMRAIGETMAVTMTVGNVPLLSADPLDPGSTLTSLIATEFGGAMDPIHRSAVLLAALALFAISMSLYVVARRVISRE